jgi:hypothetical protein
MRLTLETLRAESFAVNEGPIRACHVLDEDLQQTESQCPNDLLYNKGMTHLAVLLPYLCVLSTQNLGVKVAVILGRDCVCIGLAANFDAPIVCEIDMFYEVVGIERVEVEGGEGREHGGSWGENRCCSVYM